MPSVELYKDEKLMDDGRRRWSDIGPASTFNHGCPLTTPAAPPKFGRSTTRHQICNAVSNLRLRSQERLGENDGRLWDAVCQVALRSFDRPFGEYLGKSCVAVGCTCACQLGVFIFSRERLCIFIRMLSGGKTRFHGA